MAAMAGQWQWRNQPGESWQRVSKCNESQPGGWPEAIGEKS